MLVEKNQGRDIVKILYKNKSGFTLIELLAVIVIMSILAALLLPDAFDIFNNTFEKAMRIQEDNVTEAAKLYMQDFCLNPMEGNTCYFTSSLNKGTSSTGFRYYNGILPLETLISADYIEPIVSNREDNCTGCVVITANTATGEMTYKTYLSCGESYETQEYSCS